MAWKVAGLSPSVFQKENYTATSKNII